MKGDEIVWAVTSTAMKIWLSGVMLPNICRYFACYQIHAKIYGQISQQIGELCFKIAPDNSIRIDLV